MTTGEIDEEFIEDSSFPMLEIWADRGHFLYDDYKISKSFSDLFQQIRPGDLVWLDPTGCSVTRATDSHGDRHITEVGLVPGGERLPETSKTRLCNHFAAVEDRKSVV